MTAMRMGLSLPMSCGEHPKIAVRNAHNASEPMDWEIT
jgi:hypothetical protein